MPECCMCEHMFEEGDATWAAAVATCAQVLMRAVGLVGEMALRSCDACCLHWRLHLDDSTTNVVVLQLDSVMVALQGALIGFPVGISVGTLRIGACSCMDCVICPLSLVWGMGMLAGAITLRTCCVLQKWGNGFFKLVGICLYTCLCCINDTL
jgi:hypothetical protein